MLATTIGVLAAGSTGTETLQLQIDGIAVANFTTTRVLTSARVFDTFTYTHPTDISIDRTRVAFTNDGSTATGADRNLIVDGVTVNGTKFESEDPSVYSTGTWDAATNGLLVGFRQTEELHYNGYFQYAATGAPTPTTITVLAAGSTGTEALQLQIDGVPVANWTTTRVLTSARVFDTFTYTHPSAVSIGRIRVAFTNDGATSTGADRNLTVDGVTVAGVKYETEAPEVYSTGTWDAATNGLLPGYRQTESLHYDGYFQYAAAGTPVQIFAAGQTGQEQLQLIIAGQVVATFNNVAGNYNTGQFQTFTYNHPAAVAIGDVRVAFTNDVYTPGGADRNLRVDAVAINGVRYETEAPSVFATGTWIEGQGISSGNLQTEYLHVNGYFQYGGPATPGTSIEIIAAGTTGAEQLQLLINGQVVATFSNVGGNGDAGQFVTLSYTHPTAVDIKNVKIAFTNDGTSAAGVDRNVRIDGVKIAGVKYDAEATDVFSTGTYIPGVGVRPGLWQNEWLHTNGELQFGSTAAPGVLQLGTSLVSVNEAAGVVSIPVIRTGGSDGTVALRYTTVDSTALAGSDYIAQTGYLLFAPGETSQTIVVPITSDTLDEDNETFNVAVDEALGGARVNLPRTATVTIVDDDGAPSTGSGTGLLGAYFDDQNLTQKIFERTDATVNFDWAGGSPSSSIGADTFSIRWTGKVEPLYTETYTFRTTTDDGVRLWVNNQLIVDQWNDHSVTDHTGTIALVAGQKYDLKLEYYEKTASAVVKLAWSSARQALQIIPQSQLYSDPPTPTENGTFSGQVIVSGLTNPLAMDIDSSGRIFIAEQHGEVRVYQNGQLLPTPFLNIASRVNFVQDRGLLGVAVHPNFPATPYVYVSYTYDPPETQTRSGLAGPDGSGNRVARVSRFTADAATGFNTAIANSELVLVGAAGTWAQISHPELDSTDNISLAPSGGNNGEGRDILIADSRSHTVGNIGFGPDGKLYVANGDGASFGRVDPRASRTLSIDSLSGKILRIDPITGNGLADNPFFNGDAGANRSKVYDYGLRNPFRFAFQPGTGNLFIGDVGWNTWEEVNVGRGQNFGWPYYEGGSGTSLQTGGYKDLTEAKAYYAAGTPVTPSLWARSHSAGAVAMVVGDFYTGTIYPTSYRGALFISDFGDNELRVLRTNADGTLNSVTPLNLDVGSVTEMTMGKDGYLYYVDLVGNRVGRLLFTPAGASLLAAPTTGDFDGDGDVTGGDFLTWQRHLGMTDASPADGDADGDGVVTGSDLSVWQQGFPQSAAPISASLEAEDAIPDSAIYWLAYDERGVTSPSAALIEESVVESAPISRRAASDSSYMGGSNGSSSDFDLQETDDAFSAWDDELFDLGLPL